MVPPCVPYLLRSRLGSADEARVARDQPVSAEARSGTGRVGWLLRLLEPLLPEKIRNDVDLLNAPIPATPAGKLSVKGEASHLGGVGRRPLRRPAAKSVAPPVTHRAAGRLHARSPAPTRGGAAGGAPVSLTSPRPANYLYEVGL